ncbi:hypothetical protein [Saccharomonospora xinjiangensis]|uniref:Membrane protein involved in the export of O-antigen and teichoic acid n=1 Tax=Saccharomonospora xinjiangensis XJ-54 TaxID=882086 RepID=I0V352_9PSEU|nr:hypothetical protein [Saccharomonospora xinjiangensis]EID54555.1 hypothetical protein SacxiDRAFT_2326 [Saccharomonospora xinjiangensis XJ-54]
MATPLRPMVIVRLLAGRGAFRIGVQLMAVALLTVWGAAAYGEFANAWGTCSWLVFVPTAAEKAALKILPRTRLTTASLAGLALRIAAAPVVALAGVLVVIVLVAPSSQAALYAASATWAACTGLLMTTSGLHRLRGKPGLDAAAFTVAALGVAATTVVTWLFDFSPQAHLLVLVCGIALVITCSLAALPRRWVRPAAPALSERPSLARAFGRSTILLGITELLDAVTVSLIFVVLAVSGRVVDSGPFYLALLGSSLVCSFALYHLKLKQPTTSMNLRGSGGAAGRATASRLLRTSELAGGCFAVALGITLLVPQAREAVLAAADLPLTASGYVVLAAVVGTEIVLAAALIYARYLVENTDSRVLSLTAGVCALRLVATLLCALALAPALGAVGGFCALIIGLAVEAAVLRRLLRRTHADSRPTRSTRPNQAPASGSSPRK